MSNKITLVSSDGLTFHVEEAVALQSRTLKHTIEVSIVDSGIPLPNVTSRILTKVIEYCKKHAESPNRDVDELKAWDSEFVKVDQMTLFDLINAAHYMDIKGLHDLLCQTAADMLRGKTAAQIRSIICIENDFTPEEEEEIERERASGFSSD